MEKKAAFFDEYPSNIVELNSITDRIIGAALVVHKALGPGLLESAYESCLLYELRKRGIKVVSQVTLPLVYDGKIIDAGYQIDMLVERMVIVELKSVERLVPVHEAQILSYMRLSKKKIGLLINFNVKTLRDGIKRMIDLRVQNDFIPENR